MATLPARPPGPPKPSTSSTDQTPAPGSTNPRGIPYAPFVDAVEDYVSSRTEVEPTLKSFSEMISKYQFMEASTTRRMEGLRAKIPDIGRTLETVRFLRGSSGSRGKKDADGGTKDGDDEDGLDEEEEEDEEDGEEGKRLEVDFELNDTLYAKAHVALPTEEVYLWLGANVMLSYPIDEAEGLLVEKLDAARTSLRNCEEDLDFLREQITTLEVATARVYNWDVGQRRKERLEGGGGGGSKKD